MKVRATQLGYMNHKRMKPGAVFYVDKKHFSAKWMEEVQSKKVEEEDIEQPGKVDSSMTVDQLHAYCHEHGLAGYSGMNKAELIEAINNDELELVGASQDEDVI